MRFVGAGGTAYLTPDAPIGKGGEGEVFAVTSLLHPGSSHPGTPAPGDPRLVVKALRPGLADPRRRAKLAAMVALKPPAQALGQLAWPLDVVTRDGSFAGFVMRRITASRPLKDFCVTGMGGVAGPAEQEAAQAYERQLTLAYNLAVAVSAVHDLGQTIGDLNPNNVMVDERSWAVTLIDCDSFHVTDAGGQVFRCGVGMAEYLAPEVLAALAAAPAGTTLETIDPSPYSRQTDLFALAIHVFALLMNGCHPFSCARAQGRTAAQANACPQPADNVRDGFTPFFQQRRGLAAPVYAPPLRSMPHGLRELFRRALVQGHGRPDLRPSAREWALALRRALAAMGACPTCGLEHPTGTTCPACAVGGRMMAVRQGGVGSGAGNARAKTSSRSSGNQPGGGFQGSMSAVSSGAPGRSGAHAASATGAHAVGRSAASATGTHAASGIGAHAAGSSGRSSASTSRSTPHGSVGRSPVSSPASSPAAAKATTRDGVEGGHRCAKRGLVAFLAYALFGAQLFQGLAGSDAVDFASGNSQTLAAMALVAMALCTGLPKGDGRDCDRYLGGLIKAFALLLVCITVWQMAVWLTGVQADAGLTPATLAPAWDELQRVLVTAGVASGMALASLGSLGAIPFGLVASRRARRRA